MNFEELFWVTVALSVGVFLITSALIQDIAWFFVITWILFGIYYTAYRYYKRAWRIAAEKSDREFWSQFGEQKI